jgi:beta-N-acetylhexosaminidase
MQSDATRVGSCIVTGISGTHLDRTTAAALRSGRIAGIILLSQNIESADQVTELTAAATRAAHAGGWPDPLICIDQEGGKVSRLRDLPDFPGDPSAASLSKLPMGEIEGRKYAVGLYLRRLGFNIDFAPDVDLNTGEGIIGSRSFGPDPKKVAECAAAVIRGLHKAGVAAVIKHFPGHGLTHADSHRQLPQVSPSPSVLARHESAFADSIQADPDGVMLGHILVKSIDRYYPASLSKTFVRQLRTLAGPNRLILTDSGSMDALANYGPEPARAARALSIGVDVYLTTTPYEELGSHFAERVVRKLQSRRALAIAANRVEQWRTARTRR